MKFSIIAALAALAHLPQTIFDIKALAQTLRSNLSLATIEQELAAAPGVTDLVTKLETAVSAVATDAENLRKCNVWNIVGRTSNFIRDADTLIADVQHVDAAQLLQEFENTPQALALINTVMSEWQAVKMDFAGLSGLIGAIS